MQYSARPQYFRRLSIVAILLAWLLVIGVATANRQNIYDWLILHDYKAPAAVASLATDDTMTTYARRVFYVNRPQIEPKSQFTQCSQGQEQAAVLGCYHGGQHGIFILEVDDPRLQGVEQVTAAHEMLHAAYERLSSSDRNWVDNQLETYYQHRLTDPAVMSQMNAYKKTEPDALVDEMHSVFGTEIANLPTPLEQYYTRYFTNRSVITTDYQNYQAEFTSRQNTIAADDAQLTSWKSQINDLETEASSEYQQLQAQQAQLNAYKSAGDITAYNAGVPAYNRLVSRYNGLVSSLQSLIAEYNALVNQRNAVALENDQLVNEISSNAAPVGQ